MFCSGVRLNTDELKKLSKVVSPLGLGTPKSIAPRLCKSRFNGEQTLGAEIRWEAHEKTSEVEILHAVRCGLNEPVRCRHPFLLAILDGKETYPVSIEITATEIPLIRRALTAEIKSGEVLTSIGTRKRDWTVANSILDYKMNIRSGDYSRTMVLMRGCLQKTEPCNLTKIGGSVRN